MADTPAIPRLGDLLSRDDRALGRVLRRARAIESLTERVRAALPDPAAAHVVSVSPAETRLVVTVDGAAWAARLRFLHEDILRAAGEDGKDLAVAVRVRGPAGG